MINRDTIDNIVTTARIEEVIGGAGTRGRLEGCDIWGNMLAGVSIQEGSDPALSACK